MPSRTFPLLFTLAAACAAPAFAGDPPQQDPPKQEEPRQEPAKQEPVKQEPARREKSRHDDCDEGECHRHYYHWRWKHDSVFAWQAQLDLPAKDFGRALDQRTGLGLGMQWTHFRDNGTAHRTRLEWNVFQEGNPVGPLGLKTRASNYLLSFDRLHHFSGKDEGVYLLGGLGAVRWFVEQTPAANPSYRFHTTKLAVTGGLGYRFSRAAAVEARYLISSIDRDFDGNVAQVGVSMRF